uniref:Pop1 N-terminal domain-containing protein n=1 Tax=Hucho hucho TaxID=62062 RepID=A0A4W5K3B8_9TELE
MNTLYTGTRTRVIFMRKSWRQKCEQRGFEIYLFLRSAFQKTIDMSTAKDRMRDKKMRNQPINVTYSSQGSSHWRNGGDTPTGRGRGHGLSPHPRGQGSSHSGHAQRGGWVRGHQRGEHGVYPQALPKHITASAFAKARAAEVNAMLTAITKTTGSSHVFGALPKHMRRRAMSHNTRRLPCRLRDTANNMVGLST